MSIPIAKPGRDGSSRAALTADDTSNASGWRTLLKFNLVMALLYAAGGWLGLQLAVPPGYATVIWPASGLAVAGVMLYGRWLAIGVFLGSFAVNCYVGGAIQASGVNVVAVAIAMAIAAGSTLQAVVAAELARYLFGVPLRLGKIRDIALLAIVSGPLACVIAASVGVATLYTAGAMGGGQIIGNWLTWWIGDTVGVLVFFPLALLNPWRPWTPEWAGRPTAGFSALALACILVPLAATFYSWIITSEIVYDRNRTAFSRLAADSQQALMYRLESYSQSLDGATGLIMSSKKVTLDEWRTYVDTLDIANTLPGINGIGVIEAVRQSELADYPAKVRADGVDMTIKPKGNAFGHFIIKYIEPIEANREAVGLNIGFEKNRYDAAVHARDTGRSTITKRIFLVQDQTRSAGFLLLRPLYQGATLPATLEDRQAKFLGWVYAPFVAPRFMADLTSGQGESFEFSVYDGASDNQNQLIFTSRTGEAGADKPAFRIERTLPVMQQVWTIVWESTPAFEAQVTSYEPVLVLAGGLFHRHRGRGRRRLALAGARRFDHAGPAALLDRHAHAVARRDHRHRARRHQIVRPAVQRRDVHRAFQHLHRRARAGYADGEGRPLNDRGQIRRLHLEMRGHLLLDHEDDVTQLLDHAGDARGLRLRRQPQARPGGDHHEFGAAHQNGAPAAPGGHDIACAHCTAARRHRRHAATRDRDRAGRLADRPAGRTSQGLRGTGSRQNGGKGATHRKSPAGPADSADPGLSHRPGRLAAPFRAVVKRAFTRWVSAP